MQIDLLTEIKISDQIKELFTITAEKRDSLLEISLTNKETAQSQTIRLDTNIGYVAEIKYFRNRIDYMVNKVIMNVGKGIKVKELPVRLKIESDGRHYRSAGTRGGWKKLCNIDGCILPKDERNDKCRTHITGRERRKPFAGNNIPPEGRADIGNDTESFIIDLLHSYPDIEEVDWLARTGSTFDILFKLKDDVRRGLQIKTLCEVTYADQYNIRVTNSVVSDLLYVCINKRRDRFVLILGNQLPKTGTGFQFGSKKSKYLPFMINDPDIFRQRFHDELKNSMEVTEEVLEKSMSSGNWKEYQSILRLEEYCAVQGLAFEQCYNQNKQYDVTINGHKIQCKTTSRKVGYRYYFHISKCVKIDGKDKKIPYDQNDEFDFVLLEPSNQPNSFYVIPKAKLIEKDKLKTENCTGKVDMSILDRTDDRTVGTVDWTDDYCDAFDLLR